MAKALTIDGFLPSGDESLMQWVKNDRKGFTYWRERATVPLFPNYPLTDLILDMEKENNPCIYLAEVTGTEELGLLRGLSLYRLIDEIILYRLPVAGNPYRHLPVTFFPEEWHITESRTYKNGICRTIYRKKSS